MIYRQKCEFNFGKKSFQYPLNEVFPDIFGLDLLITNEQYLELEKLFEKYRGILLLMN